ncbi:unnamed protein product [Tuber aestivum]|uniref:Uncharacterized protein n=1 Tax=Tuber aestivum TaxID=59557 RepID=A0A292Q153_9PEZI|nr:unnamed protein product [Tuber aestivum]
MGRTTRETIRNAKISKQITQTSMTPEQYSELKVYIKSIILPGTPAFEGERLGTKESKQIYKKWLNSVLEEVGPRFFPGGAKGWVWPENRYEIYKAIHQVVRTLSIRVRRDYQKRELTTSREEGGDNEMVMAQDNDFYEHRMVDDTDVANVKVDVMISDKDKKYVQRDQGEGKMLALNEMAGKENQDDDMMEEEMDAEPIELEDLLGSMKPEVFGHFPNLDDEYFDWDEIMDPKSPDPIARLLLLLS